MLIEELKKYQRTKPNFERLFLEFLSNNDES